MERVGFVVLPKLARPEARPPELNLPRGGVFLVWSDLRYVRSGAGTTTKQGGDMTSSRIALFTALVVSALAHGRAAQAQGPVKIAITARGDVGQYAGMCGSRAGKDSLSGDLRLVNYDSEDRTAFYEGTLQRN